MNNTYYFENNTYQLPRHGFARDHDFEVNYISDTELVLKLSHNDETLKKYPFQFVLQLRYRLQGAQLSWTYKVSKPSKKKLFMVLYWCTSGFLCPTKR